MKTITSWLDKANKQKKNPKNKYENHKPTFSHTQKSHKNASLKAIIYKQRTLC